jgi:hypothetical protein
MSDRWGPRNSAAANKAKKNTANDSSRLHLSCPSITPGLLTIQAKLVEISAFSANVKRLVCSLP